MRSRSRRAPRQPAAPPATRWHALAPPLVIFVVALTVLVYTAAPTVTSEDSGELITAAWCFGIPHPPGYPLWTLTCGVFMRLFAVGSVAWRANVFSAVCTAGAAVLAYAALRETRCTRWAALGAALAVVFSRWSWTQAVITEVYALNSLLTMGILWAGLRWHRTRRNGPLLAGSLLFGLGMANHHVIGLSALAVIAWIVLQQPRLLLRWKLVLASVGLFLVGGLPYLYLPLRARANPVMNWGNPAQWDGFIAHLTRAQYGALGPIKTEASRSVGRIGSQLAYVGESFVDDLTPLLAAAAILGTALMVRRARPHALLVVLWFACTGVLFALLANFDDDRVARWAMRVFLIPVAWGALLPLAYVLDAGLTTFRRWLAGRPFARGMAVACIASAAPASVIAANFAHANYRHYWYGYDHARNLLDGLLPDALLFHSGDHNTFPLVYLHHVEGVRRDVWLADPYGYLDPTLVVDRPPAAVDPPVPWLIKHARRPVYCTVKQAPPVSNATYVPAGLLYHLLPDGRSFDATGLLAHCRYRNHQVETVRDFGACYIEADLAFFTGLQHLVDDRLDRAIVAFRAAARWGHGIKELFNNIGSALGEYGYPGEAETYFAEAVRIDPRYAMARWNLYRTAAGRGDWPAARRHLEALVGTHPDHYRAHGQLGFLLLERFGDDQGARRHWRTSLALQPEQPQIREALGEAP